MTIFVALDLSDDARAALAAVLQNVEIPGRPSPPENWHVTLRYLGSVDEVSVDRLVGALDDADLVKPFVLRTVGLGAFPKAARATVLWVAATAPPLNELAEAVDDVAERVGFGREDRPFVGHVTLARIRPPGNVLSLIESVEIPRIQIPVDRVTVFESEQGGGHPHYRPIERIEL